MWRARGGENTAEGAEGAEGKTRGKGLVQGNAHRGVAQYDVEGEVTGHRGRGVARYAEDDVAPLGEGLQEKKRGKAP